MSLKIQLLGQFKLSAGDQSFELSSRPAQTLFAYLVLNAGVTQRREKLASIIWPDAKETNARGYLRQGLWRIHKSFENVSLNWKDYLKINDLSVTFDERSDYWLDVECVLGGFESGSIEEMVRLVSLYRGELLPGFYEEWVVFERDRLRSAYHQKMNQLSDSLIQAERWDETLKWAEDWIRLGYSPEPAYRALMSAYAGLGDQAMVSATYQRCQEALESELDLEPSLETRRLSEQLLYGAQNRREDRRVQINYDSIYRPSFLDQEEPFHEERPNFVAREREIAHLDTFLDLARNDRGQVVFVTGEAGSGKTALIYEFTRRAQETFANKVKGRPHAFGESSQEDLIFASGNCNAHTGVGDPYLPFREIMELLTGDAESRWAAGAITRQHARILWEMLPVTAQALVETGPDLIDTFIPGSALLARAMAYSDTKDSWFSDLEAIVERKKRHWGAGNPQQKDLFEQYSRVLSALASIAPVVLVVDDLQWADPGSISLLFHLGRQLIGKRVLILGAYRPEEIALGRDGERHPMESVINEFKRLFGDIAINLDVTEGQHFVSELLDCEPNRLENTFREMLHSQTLGHPLFTTELLRGMQERGDLVQDRSGLWVEGPALDWDTLPARVEAVVAERISRLDLPLQVALRLASVEGETFTAEVIAKIQALDEQTLLNQLSSELDRKHRLIIAQSIQRIHGQLLSSYRFRHILTQRYLYGSLDEVERVHLHERVGTVLEALHVSRDKATGAEIVTIAPILARHFQEAKNTSKAIHYLRQAGERAIQLSAYQEALTHLNAGLELLMTLPDSPERAELELTLQQTLGMAWVGPKAYGEEVKSAYTRARQLCQQLGKTAQLSMVIGQLSVQSFVQSNYHKAKELAEESLSLAQQAEDPLQEVMGYWYLGFISFMFGEYNTALGYLKKVADFYIPEVHHQQFVLVRGSDAGMSALGYEACILWCLGYPDQAIKKSQEMLALAERFQHPFSLADALCYGGCWFNAMYRDSEALKDYSERLYGLASEIGLGGWDETGGCFYGEALAMLGQIEEGIVRIQQGISVNESIGTRCTLVGSLRALAEAQAKGNHPEQGLATIAKAYALVEKTGERHWVAELNRLQGELLLMDGDEIGAESSYKKAIEAAQEQHAKSWELRAATSLARLWETQGKKEQAYEMLGEIYDWFTEGFDSEDLKTASSLLKKLS